MSKSLIHHSIARALRAAALVIAVLALAAALAPVPSIAADDAFPSRVVRIVVPFPAGGTADILPRIVAERLSERWRQPVVVENRAGAGGNIGAEVVAASPADGYVLLASPPGPLAINESLYKKLLYRASAFEPVTVLGAVPNVLAVSPAFPPKTAQEFLAYVKANPGKVTYASQGNGSTSHLSAVLMQKLTGTEIAHVPYRGSAPALQDIMGNHVNIFFDNLGSSLNLHTAGSLRILAVGSTARVPSLPDVPTLDEAGVPGFRSTTWFAVVAPPGTPQAIVATINKAATDALRLPDVQAQFAKIGVQPIGGSPEETAKFIADERGRWGDVVRTSNIRVD
jgi:tripartite-type tricarboxylate transporter receptor subunit TctC